MTLDDAFKITETNNVYQLAKFLTDNGQRITPSAIYLWKGVIPESGMISILKAAGVYPDLTKLARDRIREVEA